MKKSLILTLILSIFSFLFTQPITAGPVEDIALGPKINAAVENKEFEKAEGLLQEYSNPILRDMSAGGVFFGFVEAGDLTGAGRIVDGYSNPTMVDMVLPMLINAYMEKRNCSAASEWLERLSNPSSKNIMTATMSIQCEGLSSSLNLMENLLTDTNDALQESASEKPDIIENLSANADNLNWVCGSKDRDGLSPYAFFLEDKNDLTTELSFATFGELEGCNNALSNPIIIDKIGFFFCASKDKDGLPPISLFQWVYKDTKPVEFKNLKFITSSSYECEQSVTNLGMRNDNLFICASLDQDGLPPYAIFDFKTGTAIERIFKNLGECINTLK